MTGSAFVVITTNQKVCSSQFDVAPRAENSLNSQESLLSINAPTGFGPKLSAEHSLGISDLIAFVEDSGYELHSTSITHCVTAGLLTKYIFRFLTGLGCHKSTHEDTEGQFCDSPIQAHSSVENHEDKAAKSNIELEVYHAQDATENVLSAEATASAEAMGHQSQFAALCQVLQRSDSCGSSSTAHSIHLPDIDPASTTVPAGCIPEESWYSDDAYDSVFEAMTSECQNSSRPEDGTHNDLGANVDYDVVHGAECSPASQDLLLREECFTFKVMHKRVFLRAEASMASPIIGYLELGWHVCGNEETAGWIKLTRNTLRKLQIPYVYNAWAKLDGAELGFGQLLQKQGLVAHEAAPTEAADDVRPEETDAPKPSEPATGNRPKAKAKAKANSKSRAREAMNALEKACLLSQKALEQPLEYEALIPTSRYSRPSLKSSAKSSIAQGERVFGYPGSADWVRVPPNEHCADWLWVPLRTKRVGGEQSLIAVWAQLEEVEGFSEALRIKWPGIARPQKECTAVYSVEWRLPDGPSKGHVLSLQTTALMSGLPAETEVQLRVAVRVAKQVTSDVDVTLLGPWQTFSTREPVHDPGAEDTIHMDTHGILRGGCKESKCSRYISPPVHMNSTPSDVCCRCGWKAPEHEGLSAP